MVRLQAQIISTIAGSGPVFSSAGYRGDGGPATMAKMNGPVGIAVDGQGNIFVADENNFCVRKITLGGIITTVAGSHTGGFSGDNGQATLARLNTPSGVAVDVAGNLYICDETNHRVRKVNTAGIIFTIADTGTSGSSGDGGPATLATLTNPRDMAVDAKGNIYIADWGAHRIRKINTSGIITTIAGISTPGYLSDEVPATTAPLYMPDDVAVDKYGNVYIGDEGNHRVRKVDTFGIIHTVAGSSTPGSAGDGGPATVAALGAPDYVAVDEIGNLYRLCCMALV